jgi:hypothetical protein
VYERWYYRKYHSFFHNSNPLDAFLPFTQFYIKQKMTKCTCSYIQIGTKTSNTKNLNPDCPLHGTDSVWYNSPEQVKKGDERSQRLRELYDAARKARENQK